MNNTLDQTDFSVTKNIVQNFTKAGVDFGNYTWNISCSDVHGNVNSSEMRRFSVNYSQDHDVPNVYLIAPPNGAIRDYWLIKFMYNVSDATSGISYCTLHLYGLLDSNSTLGFSVNDAPIVEGATESITLPLMKGNYTWNISCVDNSYLSNTGYSSSRWLRINISSGEEAFLDSCAGICGYNGFSDGACENTPSKCNNYCADCYYPSGNEYCIGGPEADTCCCIP